MLNKKNHDECILTKLWAVSIQTDPKLVIETLSIKLALTTQEFEFKWEDSLFRGSVK